MRVAYFSPLPPRRSGIADYSEELLPHLAAHLEVECFVDEPVAGARRIDLPIHPMERYAERRSDFDLALYHLGNNVDYHGAIYHHLLRYPGVVVLHEYMLHHLVQGLTLVRGETAGYIEEMRYAYGRGGERLARRLVDTGLPVDAWRYPLFERAVDRSLAVLVHNEYSRRRVLRSRPDALIERVPHHLALDDLPTESAAVTRSRLGVAEETLLVASFGFITPHKRLEVSLRAFAELRRSQPDAVYLLAGEVSPHYDLDALLAQGLGEGVMVTGRLALPELLAAMATCDVAVNLRYPSGGETSGTLMRLLGMGKAVIVSDHGSFAEVPAGCCARVGLDESELAVLTTYLEALSGDSDLRHRMGDNARRLMLAEHSLDGSAAAYAAFLERVVDERRSPFRAAPPLIAAPDSVYGKLMATVGSAVADLGIADNDLELLEVLASTVTEMGLGGVEPGGAG